MFNTSSKAFICLVVIPVLLYLNIGVMQAQCPTATFSYDSLSYCRNATPNPVPTIFPLSSAGTFSATPAGLNFVSTTTGEINLAATLPNTYIITNTISVTCFAFFTLTIHENPALTITDPAEVCFPQTVDLTDPAITAGSTGGLILSYWEDPNASTPLINPTSVDTTGTYYIMGIGNGSCTDIKPVNVVITPIPVNAHTLFTYSSNFFCKTGSNPLPTITGSPGGTFSSGLGLVINSTTGEINLALSIPETYTVTYTTTDICPESSTFDITIILNPLATYSYESPSFCEGAPFNPLPTFLPLSKAGTFSAAPAGLNFVSTSTGQIDLATSIPGDYTVTNTIPADGGCKDTSFSNNVTILDAPDLIITDPEPVCAPLTVDLTDPAVTAESTGGLALTYWKDSQATTPLLNPNAVDTSGIYYIMSTGTTTCSDIKPVLVTIDPIGISENILFAYPSTVFCKTGINPTPTITGSPGGSFSSSFGLVIDPVTGEIDLFLSALGTYPVTYTTADICPVSCTSDISITATPLAAFYYESLTFCANAGANPLPVFPPGASAGTFSATPAGLNFFSTSTGQIDLATSIPGNYTITNTIPANGGCFKDSAVQIIAIIEAPNLIITNPDTVCAPATVDITAPAVTAGSSDNVLFTYWTNPEATIPVINPSAIDTSGTYYIMSTGTTTCSDIKPVLVTIDPIFISPDPFFTYSSNFFCKNGSNPIPDVTGPPGGSFSSTPGLFIDPATGEIDLFPSLVGTYPVTYTTTDICPESSIFNVTISIIPLAAFTYDSLIFCNNAGSNPVPIFFPFASPGTFSATPDGLSFVSTSTGQINLAASDPDTYTITNTIAANGGCAETSSSIMVNILEAPDLIVTDPAPVCTPLTVDITNPAVTAGSTDGLLTYWSDAAATTPMPNPSAITTSGTYYIMSTGVVCSDIKPVTVTINPTPVLTITNPAPGCDLVDITKSVITAGSTSGTNLSYWTNMAATISLASPDSVTANGTYYIKSTASTGCFDTEPVTVSINPSPVLNITDPAPVCEPAIVNITAANLTAGSSGNGTLTYWNDLAATIPLASPAAVANNGTYYIKSTTAAGCIDIKPINVVINPPDDASFFYPSNKFCLSGSNPVPTITGLTGGSFGSSTGLSINASTGSIDLASSSIGTYTITYNTNGPCPNSSSINIEIIPSPVADFSYDEAYCQNAVPNPFPTFPPSSSAGVFSAVPVGLTFTNTTTGEIDLAGSNPGTYTVTNLIETPEGCVSTAEAIIIILPPPVITINPDSICIGSSTTLTAYGATTYTWSPNTAIINISGNGDIITVNPDNTTSYTVTGTDVNTGCTNTTSVTVTVLPYPVADFSWNPQPVTTSDPIANFNASSSTNGSSWLWDFAGLGSASVINPSFSFPDEGSYKVSLLVSNGTCFDTISHIVIVVEDDITFFIPNAFSPDGDQINDFFVPVGDGIEDNYYRMMIFNRWGALIYETDDLSKPWNGTDLKGSNVPEGSYIYKITIGDNKNRLNYLRGNFSLIR